MAHPSNPARDSESQVGVRFEPVGSKSRLSLALFDIMQQNVLTPDPAAGHVGFNVQTGEVRSRGFEAEWVANPVAGLQLIATGDQARCRRNQEHDGKQRRQAPVLTPEEMASAFADYTFQGGPLKGFGFGAGARHIGSSFMDTANLISNDAYTVFDAALHYTYGNATLQLNASNVLDKETVTCTTSGGCQYISPQIVTATVRYRW